MQTRKNREIYKIVSINIKKYRKKAKISQLQLSRQTGISYEYIRRIESTKEIHTFSIEVVDKIATSLKIETFKLFQK